MQNTKIKKPHKAAFFLAYTGHGGVAAECRQGSSGGMAEGLEVPFVILGRSPFWRFWVVTLWSIRSGTEKIPCFGQEKEGDDAIDKKTESTCLAESR